MEPPKSSGWSLDRRPAAAMVNSTLGGAAEARRPKAGTLVDADRGSPGIPPTVSQRVRAAGLCALWAALATPSITPSWSRSGPICRPSSSTSEDGERASRLDRDLRLDRSLLQPVQTAHQPRHACAY